MRNSSRLNPLLQKNFHPISFIGVEPAMRINLPVTGNEYELAHGRLIVSKTNLQGNITYVNPYFCEVSGFSKEELIGQPQNIVRHPDMPPVAFADMWNTLRSGEPWTGLVKNRRKNGDHYWVLDNLTPVSKAGRAVGYMSVRMRPERYQVLVAEEAYRRLLAGELALPTVRQTTRNPALHDALSPKS